jgi:hypothetical protein
MVRAFDDDPAGLHKLLRPLSDKDYWYKPWSDPIDWEAKEGS